MKRVRAFTLIEVLVALAIVAVALAAGMRALAQSADGASSLKARTLALWVAQNRLANAQLVITSIKPLTDDITVPLIVPVWENSQLISSLNNSSIDAGFLK